MSYDNESRKIGREPITVVEVDLDFCANSYGIAPCTASAAAGSECFNTYKTCQDKVNFSKITKTYRFCEQRAELPLEIEAIPCLVKTPNTAPAQITPGNGVGHRAKLNIELEDFAHHDRGIDPYVTTRSYNPTEQGTFFGKLRARNPYLNTRIVRVRTGYLTTPFSWTNFKSRTYVITDLKPGKRGYWTLSCSDILTLVGDEKAQYPTPTKSIVLKSDIANNLIEFYVEERGSDSLPTSGILTIDSELIAYTSAVSGFVSGCTRGYGGTTAKEHKADAGVQVAAEFNSVNVVSIIQTLLNAAGINDTYLDLTGWNIEKGYWLEIYNLNRIIPKPVSIKKLLKQISESCLIDYWWDDIDQLVKLKVVAPSVLNASLAIYDDISHFKEQSVKPEYRPQEQITTIIVYYDQIDPSAGSSASNFTGFYAAGDINAESELEYNTVSTKEIFAEWFSAANYGLVVTLASRVLARFSDTPFYCRFKLDAKDANSLALGEELIIDTEQVQGDTGANEQTRVQLISIDEVEVGSVYECLVINSTFKPFDRYGFIAPDGIPDYSAATEDQRQKYCFIGYDAADFPDGYPAYKII